LRFQLDEFAFLGHSFESPFLENEFVLPKRLWLDCECHIKSLEDAQQAVNSGIL